MNYIREINAFYDWLETNTLADTAIALWHALMHTASKAGWPGEFAVAISVLQNKTGLKKDAIIRARHRLQQVGRIDFRSRKGQQSAVYRLISFENSFAKTDAIASAKQTQNDSVVLTDTKCNTNREQSATQTAAQSATINKLNKTKLKENTCSKEQDAAACPDIPASNQPLIIELTTEYRGIPGVAHEQSDYAFIGSCYNAHGYNAVLEAIHILKTRMEAGFTPDKPKIYLMGILKKGEEPDGRTGIRSRSPRKAANTGKYDWFYEES